MAEWRKLGHYRDPLREVGVRWPKLEAARASWHRRIGRALPSGIEKDWTALSEARTRIPHLRWWNAALPLLEPDQLENWIRRADDLTLQFEYSSIPEDPPATKRRRMTQGLLPWGAPAREPPRAPPQQQAFPQVYDPPVPKPRQPSASPIVAAVTTEQPVLPLGGMVVQPGLFEAPRAPQSAAPPTPDVSRSKAAKQWAALLATITASTDLLERLHYHYPRTLVDEGGPHTDYRARYAPDDAAAGQSIWEMATRFRALRAPRASADPTAQRYRAAWSAIRTGYQSWWSALAKRPTLSGVTAGAIGSDTPWTRDLIPEPDEAARILALVRTGA